MKFVGIKRKSIITVIILFSIICLTVLIVIAAFGGKDKTDKSNQDIVEQSFTVNYMVENAQISGHVSQSVKRGEDGTVISVIPNIGYRFVKWEDTGSTNPRRQDFNVQQDIIARAIIEGPLTCHIIFHAGKGGTVEGKLEQTVIYGGKGEPVIAIPDEGYRFVKWSDGETEAVRENQSMKHYGLETADVYAEFERDSRYVTVYYAIDENCCSIVGQQSQTIKKGESTTSITIVPKLGYYFMGWVNANDPDKYFDKDSFTRQEINVQEDMYLTPRFQGPVNSHIVFHAGKGGTVEGKLEQTVIYGGKGEPVIAIPDEGYRFVKWSDGETEAVRENTNVTWYGGQAFITAEFERYSRKFEYVYNGGVSKEGETEIEINLDNLDSIVLPVPERENCKFEGWYSDWHHEIQVADENGEIQVRTDWLLNDEFYDYITNPEGYLYAKWSTKKQLPTYKILMIYLTEVHGNFRYWTIQDGYNNEKIKVDYVMPDVHRRICKQITVNMSKYLNAVFNETVRFEVDEYFTTQPVDETVFVGSDNYYMPATQATNGITEVHSLLADYDSVITTYSLCGYENSLKLTGGAGSGNAKYATVVLDYFLYPFTHEGSGYYGDELENILDNYYSNSVAHWESFMNTYIHEFIHTVEMQLGIMDTKWLHAAYSHYANIHGALSPIPYNVDIPYLLNKYEADGEKWGIPYEFWVKKSQERN